MDKVKIGLFNYDIIYIPDEEADKRKIEGETNHTNKSIELAEYLKRNPVDDLNVTIHECMHGWMNAIGCNIKEVKYGRNNHEIEEFFVNILTQGFLTVLKDNQDLLKTLYTVLKK